MNGRKRRVSAWARGFGLSLWLAAGIVGSTAAQSGTITFRGAITEPSCGFEPQARGVHATCLTAGGQPVSKALTAGSGKPASVRVGAVHLWMEPLAGRRGGTNAYIVVATYL